MVSVLSRSKTAYLVISKNRPISRLKKKYVIKGDRNMSLNEVEREKKYFTRSLYSKYGVGALKS